MCRTNGCNIQAACAITNYRHYGRQILKLCNAVDFAMYEQRHLSSFTVHNMRQCKASILPRFLACSRLPT